MKKTICFTMVLIAFGNSIAFCENWKSLPSQRVCEVTPVTNDNHNKSYDKDACDGVSSDGRWCADKVSVTLNSGTSTFQALDTSLQGCKEKYVEVSTGVNTHWFVGACVLSVDKHSFRVDVFGYTKPQSFHVCAPLE